MNTPAKRAAAMGRLNRAIKKIRELHAMHAMRDWLAMGAAIAAYWDAKREWEGWYE